HRGDNYGCKLKIISNDYKKLKLRFIIRPDWSEIDEVKGLTVFANNYAVKVNKVDYTFYYVIYEAVIHLYNKKTEILIYS
ncbi:Host range protein, partial [Monkeypox virus]